MIPGRWALALLCAAALLLLLARILTGAYVESAWYASLGASSVWSMRWQYGLLLSGGTAILGAAFAFLHLYIVRRSVVSLVLPRRVANLDIGEEIPRGRLTGGAGALAGVLGLALSVSTANWPAAALARHGRLFGETDLVFEYDLGFFVYWLPLERILFQWALVLACVVTAVVIGLYALTPSLSWDRRALHVSAYVRRHLAILAAGLILIVAWGFRIEQLSAMLSGSGPGGVFSALDRARVLRIAPLLVYGLSALAVVVAWTGWTGQRRLAFGAVIGGTTVALGLRFLAPLVLGQLMAPDTVAEAEARVAIQNGFTRRAFAADDVIPIDTSKKGHASGVDFSTPAEAAAATPLWDPGALRRALAFGREEGTTPDGLGWETTPGGLTAYLVVHPAPTDTVAAPWRLTRVLAAAVDGRGGPVWVDPSGAVGDEETPLPPALVFDGASRYDIVADPDDTLSASSLGSRMSRIAHALYLQNLPLLLRAPPDANAKIVLRRGVRERVGALAPFLAQGSEVFPLVTGDTLYWVLELYSASNTYPFSRPLHIAGAERRYFHHAATAVVSARTGRVMLAATATPDPVLRSWEIALPGLFMPRAALPPDVLAELPPPIDGAEAQAATFAPFGVWREQLAPDVDPTARTADSAVAIGEPMYTVLGSGNGLGWVQPIVDENGDVRGALFALGGRTPRTLWHPTDSPFPVWAEVVDRLRQGRTDKNVPEEPIAAPVRGVVRAIPLRDRVAFAQTIYSWPPASPPIAIHAVTWDADSLSSGASIAAALGVHSATTPGPWTPQAFRARVSELYDLMTEALRRGDLAAFGAAFSALGELLGRAPR